MLYSYRNGDITINIFSDGTKEIIGDGNIIYPISMDIKITNFCDAGCSWCHEKSTIEGEHGNIMKYINFFSDLPHGTELALGGGNPLSHPNLKEFLIGLKNINIISNLTVNSLHLKQKILSEIINEKLIYGLGISYNRIFKEKIKKIDYKNIVVHMIAGINTYEEMLDMLESGKKILILGYKKYGRGEKFYNETIEKNIKKLYIKLPHLFGKGLVSFDNLAIKQLKPQRFFNEKKWNERYMGDDGTRTMYMDLIDEKYALNSHTKEKFNINDNIINIFNNIKTLGKK